MAAHSLGTRFKPPHAQTELPDSHRSPADFCPLPHPPPRKSPAFTRADLAAAATLRERALADATAYRLVESLTTEVGPRPAGSPGDKAAVAWALREMQRLGFANVRTVEAHRAPLGARRSRILGACSIPAIHADARLGRKRRYGQRRDRGGRRDGEGPRCAGSAASGRSQRQDRVFQQSHGTHP